MSLLHSLRRATLAIAATGLLAGGALAVAGASAASAQEAPNHPSSLPLIALNNDTAEVGTDCPAGGGTYWHFVLAPNDGKSTITTVFLRLATGPDTTEDLTFTGTDLIPNQGQVDNIFIAVPAGHELTDLVKIGSQAAYSGNVPNQFNLSHVCVAAEPTTTTTEAPTTSTTVTPTTVTPTTATPTTVTPPPAGPTTIPAEVAGVTTIAIAPEVLGATQVNGELPYTGSNTTGVAVVGVAVAAAGAGLVALARSRARQASGS